MKRHCLTLWTTEFSEDKTILDNYQSLIDIIEEYTYKGKDRNIMLGILREKKTLFDYMNRNMKLEKQLACIRDMLTELTLKEEEKFDMVNAVHITKDICFDRKHNFICGLSAQQIQKKMPESPAFSDANLKKVL